jgi:hypothetical protein
VMILPGRPALIAAVRMSIAASCRPIGPASISRR